MSNEKLVGTWKLKSFQFEFADTGEAVDMYGSNPNGYLILNADDRMMAIVASGDRKPPKDAAGNAALFNSMMAYTGKYRLEGDDQFITTVDLAWHPAWMGTEQARHFTVNGDMLSITSAVVTHPMFRGRNGKNVVKWTRA